MAESGDHHRRFGGISRLYGDGVLERLMACHVGVVGVGGVGSWAVEAMARSGIGGLTLIDLDHVTESNINRQLPALEQTLGKAKVQVLADRVAQINPRCVVRTVEDFVTTDNVAALVDDACHWWLDCIDNFRVKAALIAYCRRTRLKVLTAGGAGGRIDATRVRLADLARTTQDPLLSRTRKLLRQSYGFSTNPKRRFEVPAVWSDEPIAQSRRLAAGGAGLSGLNCAGFGSLMPVTATFGLVAAGYVINRLSVGRDLTESGGS